jgi:hypothetical protein
VRSLIRLLLFCVLLLAGAPALHASLPQNRAGEIFSLAASPRPEIALQVPELRLDNPALYGESASGRTFWSMFDPEGLFWKEMANDVAGFVTATLVGWTEANASVGKPIQPATRAEGMGLQTGRLLAVAQGAAEMVQGGTTAAGGAAFAPETGGVSILATVAGAVEAVHGAVVTVNGVRLAMQAGPLPDSGTSNPGGKSTREAVEENQKKVPNPDGSKGKLDHQEANKKLVDELREEHPDADAVLSNKSIKELTGLNRRPDATVIKDGKVVKVGEVARTNKDGSLVSREQIKQEEYDKAGIPSTVKTLPSGR